MALLSELIRHDEPLFTAGMCAYPYKPALERKYKFESRFGDEVKLHYIDPKDPKTIYLPRGLCPVGADDRRHEGKDVIFPKKPTPKPNQVQMFEEVADFLLKGQSGIALAYTGFGKTVVGYHAAATVKKKTLVITTKDDIYKQWLLGAQTFLGLPPHKIGEIRQDKCEVVDTDFCVAMIHSLASGKYPAWALDEFGLVIFDEGHRVPAESFQVVAGMIPAKLRLVLTATLDRSDGKELLIQAHAGPVRAKTEAQLMIPKVLRYTTGWVCPRVPRTDKTTGQTVFVRMPHEPGRTIRVEKSIAADEDRNHMVCEVIEMCYSKGKKIVVFSTLIDHLQTMHRRMVKLGVSGKDMGFYIGTTTKAEAEAREKVKVRPIIFTTYGMMAEGTDIPWLDTCILAMPRSKVTQPVGRVRREYEGKGVPIVIDFLDADSNVLVGYSASRKGWYDSISAPVIDMA